MLWRRFALSEHRLAADDIIDTLNYGLTNYRLGTPVTSLTDATCHGLSHTVSCYESIIIRRAVDGGRIGLSSLLGGRVGSPDRADAVDSSACVLNRLQYPDVT